METLLSKLQADNVKMTKHIVSLEEKIKELKREKRDLERELRVAKDLLVIAGAVSNCQRQ